MDEILMWIIVGVVAIAAVALAIIFIIKLVKATPEKRKEMLLDFLIKIVTAAKDELENEDVEQQIEKVESEFNEKASWLLKLILFITSSANLQELIKDALNAVLAAGNASQEESED